MKITITDDQGRIKTFERTLFGEPLSQTDRFTVKTEAGGFEIHITAARPDAACEVTLKDTKAPNA